eukprot:14883565-Alexandrium_andersonii.AAC.1
MEDEPEPHADPGDEVEQALANRALLLCRGVLARVALVAQRRLDGATLSPRGASNVRGEPARLTEPAALQRELLLSLLSLLS